MIPCRKSESPSSKRKIRATLKSNSWSLQAGDSPILSFLQKGGGLHHLCYEVTNLDSELDEMRSRGFRGKKTSARDSF